MNTQDTNSSKNNNILTYQFSELLDGATRAKVDIHTDSGNLSIDRLAGGEDLLASGSLQYTEKQGPPACSISTTNGQAEMSLKAGEPGKPWFRLPWAACHGATEWQVQLNPAVECNLTACSGGGNVRLDLGCMAVSRLSAETGGGNVEVILPGNASSLDVAARTGAGNVSVSFGSSLAGSNAVKARSGAGDVVVHLPHGIAARIQARSGAGKVILDPQFGQVDKGLYQSPGYDTAADRVDLTLQSGAGNVIVDILP